MTDQADPVKPTTADNYDPAAGDAHQKRRRGWRYLAAAALLALIVVGLWPKPIPVELATVERAPLIVTVDEEGVTQVRHRYVVSSPVSGNLRRIVHKPGATVVAGETILAVLQPAEGDILDMRSRAQAKAREQAAQSQVAQAGAQRARAAAALELATTEAARQRVLAADRLVSQQELDVAENRERTAGQENRAAEFALQVANFELEQARAVLMRTDPSANHDDAVMTITSPISGKVLRVFQESARIVTGGMPLIEVGNTENLEVRIEVLSRDGVAIAPGATVWLEQWGGAENLEARVRLVEPAAFTKISALGVEEQRVNVLADLITPPEDRLSLGDGYRVEARIERSRLDNTLQTSAGALFQQDDQWWCFVLKSGRAEMRPIEIGLSNGVQTQIVKGLDVSEQVILYPGDRIEADTRVRPLR